MTLLYRKLSNQIKEFDKVTWFPETGEAYISLGHFDCIHVSYDPDDRLCCFGTHDTINISYSADIGRKRKLNQELIDQITEFVKTEPSTNVCSVGVVVVRDGKKVESRE